LAFGWELVVKRAQRQRAFEFPERLFHLIEMQIKLPHPLRGCIGYCGFLASIEFTKVKNLPLE
jgi:hypothetical protein